MSNKKCAYCSATNKLTKEHTVNKSLIIRLGLNESPGYEYSKGKYITNNSTIKDVCEKCNNGVLSNLDDYFLGFIEENLPLEKRIEVNSKIELNLDFNKLSRWLLKTLYNSERKNSYERIEQKLRYYKDYILGKEVSCRRPLRICLEILYDIPSSELEKVNSNIEFLKNFVKLGNVAFSYENQVGYIKQFTIGNFMFYIFIEDTEEKNEALSKSLQDFLRNEGVTIVDLSLSNTITVSNRSIVDILALTYQGNKTFIDYEQEIKSLVERLHAKYNKKS